MANYVIEVEENINAESFFVQSTGDVIPDATTIVVSASYPDETTMAGMYTIQQGDDLQQPAGITIKASDLGFGSIFKDGIYSIKIKDSQDTELVEAVEGFIAVVSVEVMKNSLNYRQGLDTSQRWLIQEQNRLLLNLSYAAELGLLDSFIENLGMLQNLV